MADGEETACEREGGPERDFSGVEYGGEQWLAARGIGEDGLTIRGRAEGGDFIDDADEWRHTEGRDKSNSCLAAIDDPRGSSPLGLTHPATVARYEEGNDLY